MLIIPLFYVSPFYPEGFGRTKLSIRPMSLSRQRQRAPCKAIRYNKAYVDIINAARILQVRGVLMLSQQTRAREAVTVLETP